MVQKTIKTIKQSKQSNIVIDYKDRAKISRSKRLKNSLFFGLSNLKLYVTKKLEAYAHSRPRI